MVRPVSAIIQARMGSTRLPGKILRQLADKSVLGHILMRLQRVRYIDNIIVATSKNMEDDIVVEECAKYNVKCFRGSNLDVLSRFYHTAREYDVAEIIRICADNVMIDWNIIEKQILAYQNNKYDIVSTGSNIPLGLGGEIFSFEKLEEAYRNAKEEYQREHVTPYIYEHCKNIFKYQIKDDYSKYRFTLDTPEDWMLINKLYSILYKGTHDFVLADIVKAMQENPALFEINKNIKQISVLK